MDKYERVELIGEGSFGTVYKYKCGEKFFAMKFMPKCQKESDLKGTIHTLRKTTLGRGAGVQNHNFFA